MARIQALEFLIHLRDSAKLLEYQTQLKAGTGPGEVLHTGPQYHIFRAPTVAAVEFGDGETLPMIDVGQPIPTGGKGYLTSKWWRHGENWGVDFDDFPRTVKEFGKSTGWWIFGNDITFRWCGTFVGTPEVPRTAGPPGQDEPEVLEPALIPQRSWIYGAETNGGEYMDGSGWGYQAQGSQEVTRSAARATDGYGLCTRAGTQSMSQVTRANRHSSWEQYYLRWRRESIEGGAVHQLGGTVAGMLIEISPTGQLVLYKTQFEQYPVMIGVTSRSLPPDTWVRVDVLIFWSATHIPPSLNKDVYCDISIRVNRELWLTGQGHLGIVAAGAALTHTYSRLGYLGGVTGGSPALAVDVDDWRCSAVPVDKDDWPLWKTGSLPLDPVTYAVGDYVRAGDAVYRALQPSSQDAPKDPLVYSLREPYTVAAPGPYYWVRMTDSIDWLNGTRMQLIRPTAIEGTTDWVGGAPGSGHLPTGLELMQHHPVMGNYGLTCDVSAAPITVLTDAPAAARRDPNVLGFVSLVVSAFSNEGGYQQPAGTVTRQLGYRLGTDPPVLYTPPPAGFNQFWLTALYAPPPMLHPAPVPEIALTYVHDADTTSITLVSLVGIIELIGKFGPEDMHPDERAPALLDDAPWPDLHNAAYPFSPWAGRATAQGLMGPVIRRGATYTGNGGEQTLTFPAPVTFLYIRATTSGGDTCVWWPSQNCPHRNLSGGSGPPFLFEADQNPEYANPDPDADQQLEFRVRLVDSRWTTSVYGLNAPGVVYQYIAIMDPARRFFLADAFSLDLALRPWTHRLIDPSFVAEGLLIQREVYLGSFNGAMYYGGPGDGPGNLKSLAGFSDRVYPGAVTIEPGALTVETDWVVNDHYQLPFLALRRADGTNDPNQARVMAFGNYTGDGTTSRVIPITPPSGRPPMWVLVVEFTLGGYGYARDPSHTGTDSGPIGQGGVVIPNGITAGGIDSFTVGSKLNASGTVYSWFCLPGCEGEGNNGWSTNCEEVINPTTPGPGPPPVNGGNGNGGNGNGGNGNGGNGGGGGSACVVDVPV